MPNCQLCNQDNKKLIITESRWSVYECKNCGFVYVNPRPDEAYLKEYYQSYLPDTPDKIKKWKYMMSGVFKKTVSIIDEIFSNKKGKLLDIGCAHGFFLQMMKDKEWDTYGIDLSKSAVDYARSTGLEVSNITLMEMKCPDNEFDVITMFYVLEHLLDPVSFMQDVYRILKPGGLLIVRVPHTTPIVKLLKILRIPNRLYDAPSHLSDFSPKTIKLLLQKTGFKDIKTIIGGITYPDLFFKRFASYFFGGLAMFLANISFDKWLLSGVSKTTIARK